MFLRHLATKKQKKDMISKKINLLAIFIFFKTILS